MKKNSVTATDVDSIIIVSAGFKKLQGMYVGMPYFYLCIITVLLHIITN